MPQGGVKPGVLTPPCKTLGVLGGRQTPLFKGFAGRRGAQPLVLQGLRQRAPAPDLSFRCFSAAGAPCKTRGFLKGVSPLVLKGLRAAAFRSPLFYSGWRFPGGRFALSVLCFFFFFGGRFARNCRTPAGTPAVSVP